MPLRDILNGARLRPSRPHPAHVLSSGMLLEKWAIWNIEKVTICLDCERALSQNKTLPLSLANNMWIGEIPWVPKISCKEDNRATGCYGITVCELVSTDLNVIVKAVISNVD